MQEGEGASTSPKRVMASQIDTYTSFESISPAFDPNRDLLRCVFFIGAVKTWYISIGYYPSRNYQPLVEIGGPEKSPIILNDRHVLFMAEHLPAQCGALCNDERYSCTDEDFRMKSTGSYKFARVYLGTRYISFKVLELRYLSYIYFMVRNQLTRYTEAMADVMNYVTAAIYSDKYVEPPINASKSVLYYHLFEELKSLVCIMVFSQ